MNEQLKLGLTLMVVTIIAAVGLSYTNQFTQSYIETQKQSALKESLGKVILADHYEEKESYYNAYDENDVLIGKVLMVEAKGYSSTIKALVGVDLENTILGVDILEQQETPGLGTKIEGPLFLGQFVGKTEELIKLTKDGGEIDGITGATISSRAITDAIRQHLEECPCDGETGASPEYNPDQEVTEEEPITDEQIYKEIDNLMIGDEIEVESLI